MPYDIRTKDGIVITDIPDTVAKDDPRLKAMVAEMRATGQKSRAFSGAASPAPVASAPAAPQPTAADPWRDALPGGMASPPAAPPEEPKTDLAGLMGAAVRGAGPIAAGAGIGAVLGAPIGGVGAVPGAIAGAGSMALSQFVGDPLVDVINNLFGTKITRPTDALNQLFTAIGVPEPDTAAERVVQAAASGAGGAAGSVALGQALSSAAKPLAPSVMKAVGDALAAGSVQQVTGGLGGAASAQTAAEMGAPVPVQIAAWLGGGMIASRLAPGSANLRVPAAKTAEELSDDVGRLVKKASSIGPGRAAAREKIVKMARVNPEAKAAADRLGFELPADVFIDDPQVRSAAGLARSVSGSEMEGAWRASVQNALDKADDIIRQYDAVFVEGSPAPGVVSSRVKDSLTKTRAALSKQADDLYAEVEKAIPKETPVRLDKLAATLDDIVREVGTDGLSAQETRLLAMAKTAGKPGGATYGRLLREKNLIGQAIARKESPYGNMEAGTLKRLYGALADDQLANVDATGGGSAIQAIPKPKISGKELSPILQDIDSYGPLPNNDPYKKQAFDEIRKSLKEKGVTHVDAYHVTDAPIDVLQKTGIKGTESDFIGRSGGNVRDSSVYMFLDPEDITRGYAGILGAKNPVNNVVHIKIPLSELDNMRWDSNFNITFDTYSSTRKIGNIPAEWISGVYKYDPSIASAQANASIAPGGLGEKLRKANELYKKERELGDRIVEAFGNDFEGSIANTMKTAIVSASKGDGAKFARMIEHVPEDLQRETVATSLASVARNRRGEFGFAEYAQTYRGLRANPEVYSKIVKTLGPESDEVMRDLYEVSKRITDARANVLTTGKANQALLQSMTAESLLGKILGATIMRPAAAAGGSVVGGPWGSGLALMLADTLANGKKDALRAAGKMFTSAKFQNLITKAAEGQPPNIGDVRALARDSAFQAFAKAARLPVATDQRELWIFGALQSGAFQPGGIQGDK